MSYFDQGEFDVRCEWGLAGVQQLARADVLVIVDVLSFSTAVEIAVARGAEIFPYPAKDESAIQYSHEKRAELAASRNQSGAGYSLSPKSLMNIPRGTRLVLPSPNGSSISFAAKSRSAVVIAGCLRNARAVARHARSIGQSIAVIPAGERWMDGTIRFALEDWLGAGAILQHLNGSFAPEALSAIASFEASRVCLYDTLRANASGRELVERGFTEDIELAAEIEASEVVPVLTGDSFTAAQ